MSSRVLYVVTDNGYIVTVYFEWFAASIYQILGIDFVHSASVACGFICIPVDLNVACRKMRQFSASMITLLPQCGHSTICSI